MMKKLALFLLVAYSSFVAAAINHPVAKAIQAGNVESVRSLLETWPLMEEDAPLLINEVNQLLLRTKDKAPWHERYGALTQTLISAYLLYLSGNVVVQAYSETGKSASFWKYCKRLYNAKLWDKEIVINQDRDVPNFLVPAVAGSIATGSAGSFVCGLYRLISNKNTQYVNALAIKTLVYYALIEKKLLVQPMQNSHL